MARSGGARGSPGRARAARRVAALLVPVAAVLVLDGCAGHAVSPAVPFDQAPRLDFRAPGCEPAAPPAEPTPDDAVVVRYLGAGGLYVGWRGAALLTGPFFSNPDVWEVGFERRRWRRGDILRGLRGLPMARVGAILVGHSHYDHLGDVPFVAEHLAPRARIYGNESGARSLAAWPQLGSRVVSVESPDADGVAGILLRDADGAALPFRVRPVASNHAPHFDHVTLMSGEAREKTTPWSRRSYWSLKAGRPHAFVIDLLAEARESAPVLFRIYYQDSASRARRAANGIPPPDPDGPAYDLAVVCMASAHLVRPYPKDLLEAIRPRHVLVTHYEDFFKPWGSTGDFVLLLTENRADAFLERTTRALGAGGQELTRPVGRICGATASGWTMPLVGEWLAFGRSKGEGDLRHDPPR